MQVSTTALVQTTAFAAVSAGLSVLPPREDGTKAPLAEGGTWKERQEARATFREVSAWYASGLHGVGIVCGRISGGVEGYSLNAMDFDDGPTYGRFVEMAEVCGLSGLLAKVEAGYSEETPKGGRHLLVRCPGEWPTTKLAERPDPDRKHGRITLVETKCEGGYIILAPSFGPVHPSGKPYHLLAGNLSTIAEVTEPEWSALCDLASSLDEMPSEPAHEPRPRDPARGDDETPGSRFAAAVSWDDLLSSYGWKLVFRRGEASYWRRPDKGIGVSATANHGGSDLFYCFSTSTPFEPRRSYTKFGVYACLEHAGDYHAAALALVAQGFGSTPYRNGTPRDSRNVPPTKETKETKKGGRSGGASFVSFVSFVGGDDPPVVEQPWPEPPNNPAFHGLAGAFVDLVRPHTEADPLALLSQFLVSFGSVIGTGPHFVHDDTVHRFNLFLCLVGLSSKGRKGTSWDITRTRFRSVDEAWTRTRIVHGLSSGEGLIWAVRDPVIKQEPIKVKGIVTGYQEVIEDHGVEDKRLLVVETEFANPLKVMKREGNTLSVKVRQAWDSGDMRVMTKDSKNIATGAHISIIGHATKHDINIHLTEADVANGFANRFLWACVRRSQVLPFGGRLTETAFAAIVEDLREAVRLASAPGELKRTEEADALWGDVYGPLSEGKPGLLGAVIGRGEAQVMRLAGIYALLDGSRRIGRVHLEAALAFWDYCERSARYIFGDSLGDDEADSLLAALRSSPLGLTRSQIMIDVFNKNKSSARVAQILGRLLGYGLVRSEKVSTEGRPAETWFAV